MTCDLENTKLISSIGNKAGGNYIENTMDVFVRMTDGTIYYASDSDKDAIANIFRMGYYYYENRIEGLSFNDGYKFVDGKEKKLNCGANNILRYNMTEYIGVEDGGIAIRVTNNQDPWFSYKIINFSAFLHHLRKTI